MGRTFPGAASESPPIRGRQRALGRFTTATRFEMQTTGTVRKDVIDSLRAIPLFGRVSEADLEELATHLIERRFPKNATVVEEGLPGDYMYVIREGRAKVTKASEDGREKIMNFLEAGAFFGDMALLG